MRRVLRVGAFSLLLRVLGLLASFLIGVVLARALGPAEYGIYGLVTTLVAIAMTVGTVGTPQLAVRDLSILAGGGNSAAIIAVLRRFGRTTGLASIVIAVAVLAVGWWLTRGKPQLHALIIPASLLIPLTASTTLIAAELRGLGHMMKGQWMDVFARPALGFLLTFAWVLTGISLSASDALWIQAAVAGLTALVSWAWIRQVAPASDTKAIPHGGSPWLHAALFLMAVELMHNLGGTYAVIMMGWLDSDVALGMFRVAFACNIVVAFPVTVMHVILAPSVARLHQENRKKELQRLLALTSAALLVMIAPIAAAAYFIGRPAIELVFGAEYAPAWLPLFYLSVSQLIYGLFGLSPILLSMCGGERTLFKIYVTSTTAGIFAAYPLIGAYGATGAAIAMVISNTLVGLLSWTVGRKAFGVNSTFIPLLRRSSWKPAAPDAPSI